MSCIYHAYLFQISFLFFCSANMTKLDMPRGNLRANLRLQLMKMQAAQEDQRKEPTFSQSFKPAQQTQPQTIQIPAPTSLTSTEVPTSILTVSIVQVLIALEKQRPREATSGFCFSQITSHLNAVAGQTSLDWLNISQNCYFYFWACPTVTSLNNERKDIKISF